VWLETAALVLTGTVWGRFTLAAAVAARLPVVLRGLAGHQSVVLARWSHLVEITLLLQTGVVAVVAVFRPAVLEVAVL
jgi:hypothetical protein